MARVERFEDLRCWQAARELVRTVYQITNADVFNRDLSFRSQIRSAAISTMSNIAEGFGRFSAREFIRFLEFSFTSSNEVKSLSYAAIDNEYLSDVHAGMIQSQAEKVKAMDLALIRYLKRRGR